MSIGERLIWGVYDVIANAMTTTGLLGLIFFAAVFLKRGIDRLVEEQA